MVDHALGWGCEVVRLACNVPAAPAPRISQVEDGSGRRACAHSSVRPPPDTRASFAHVCACRLARNGARINIFHRRRGHVQHGETQNTEQTAEAGCAATHLRVTYGARRGPCLASRSSVLPYMQCWRGAVLHGGCAARIDRPYSSDPNTVWAAAASCIWGYMYAARLWRSVTRNRTWQRLGTKLW